MAGPLSWRSDGKGKGNNISKRAAAVLVLIFLDLSVSPAIVGSSCLSVHWESVPLLVRYRILIIDKSKSKTGLPVLRSSDGA